MSPIFDAIVHLPLFSSGHNTRLAILALLCLALLAGWGLDDLLARTGSQTRRRAVLGAAAVLFALPLAWAAWRGSTSFDALGDGLRVAWGFEHPRVRACPSCPTSSARAPCGSGWVSPAPASR